MSSNYQLYAKLSHIDAGVVEALQVERLCLAAHVVGLESWTSEGARDNVGIGNVGRAAWGDAKELNTQ